MDPNLRPTMDECPQCGGILITNDDGWKRCGQCGYANPCFAQVRTVLSLVGLTELERDPFAVDGEAQALVCRAWTARHGVTIKSHVTVKAANPESLLSDDGASLLTPSRRIFDIAVRDADALLALCQARGTAVYFADTPEPAYTDERRDRLHRVLSLPTMAAPRNVWPDGLS